MWGLLFQNLVLGGSGSASSVCDFVYLYVTDSHMVVQSVRQPGGHRSELFHVKEEERSPVLEVLSFSSLCLDLRHWQEDQPSFLKSALFFMVGPSILPLVQPAFPCTGY